MHQKVNVLNFFYIYICPRRASFKKKSSLTIVLSCLVLSSCFPLDFDKHVCNGGEEEETYIAFRIKHVFVHTCEACCGHLSIEFARRMEKVCHFEIGL